MTTQTKTNASPPISVSLLVYNARDRVRPCLDAILNQSHPPAEVLVIDNASTDDTAQIVARDYPQVRLVRSEINGGCSGGRNLQLSQAKHRHVMIIDDDVQLNPTCLEHLAGSARDLPEAAAWSPRVCYEQDRSVIQFDGVQLHFIGEAVLTHPNTTIEPNLPDEPFETLIAGGVAFLVDRDKALAIGGYDESFYFGKTDGDFSFRLHGSGEIIYTVPKAIAYHHMKARGISQIHRQVRNRWALILKSYAWRTVILLLPALLLYELSLMVFLTAKGGLGQYIKGNIRLFGDLPAILRERGRVQKFKHCSDRDVLSSGGMNIRHDLVKNPLVRHAHQALDAVLRAYWSCVRPLV